MRPDSTAQSTNDYRINGTNDRSSDYNSKSELKRRNNDTNLMSIPSDPSFGSEGYSPKGL